MKEERTESKRYVVFANQRGTRAVKVEYKDPEEGKSVSSDDYLSPVALVYDHPHDVYGDRVAANIVGKPITGNPEISDLVGKLLLIVDATFMEEKQKDAFKALLKQTIYQYANDLETKAVQTYQSIR